jgi:putative tryptophan/tyrosine transport system substrate-binding protein
MFGMRRREFITLLGGAAAWPVGVRAQQTALPVLGLLSSVAFNTRRDQVAGFHRGLQEAGYVQGKNVAIEYRSANNQVDLLPRLAADLVTRQVAGRSKTTLPATSAGNGRRSRNRVASITSRIECCCHSACAICWSRVAAPR